MLLSGYTFAPECFLFVEYDDLINDPVVQDGLQRNLTAYDVKREVRKDKRWQYSEEGWDTILDAFDRTANTFGFSGGIVA